MSTTDPSNIWAAFLASGALGGEQTQEHIQYNAHTQVIVQILQAFALFPSIAAILGGVWLLAGVLGWIVASITDQVSLVLISAAIAAAGLLIAAIARWILGQSEVVSGVFRPLAELVIATAAILLILNLIRLLATGWTLEHGLRLVGGLAAIVAGSLLTWRFSNELWNPLFPKSPMIYVLEQLVASLTPEREEVEILRPYPVNAGARLQGIGYVEHEDDEEEDEPATGQLDPRFLDLVRFVELAARHGLARDDTDTSRGLITKPRHRLPSGRPLTKPYYNELIHLAIHPWNIVNPPATRGQPYTWKLEPDAALAMLRAVVETVQEE
jgi:hypothetical protein